MVKQASKEFHLDTGDGHKIYCAVYNSSLRGAPLLLIHGGAGHTFDMDKLHLPNRRVIVMHQRGMGNSLPAGEIKNNTIESNINDIELVRAHFRLRRMDMFAWSFGAVYMAGYAFKHPERCKSLMAYAPYFGSDDDYEVISKRDEVAARTYYDFHGSDNGKGITASAFNKASSPDYNARFKAYHAVFNLAALNPVPAEELLRSRSLQEWKDLFAVRQAHAALDRELFDGKDQFLRKMAIPLKCPVTLAYGRDDVWSAPNSYDSDLFPASRTIIIPGAGHDVHEVSKLLLTSRPPKMSHRTKASASPQ